MKSLDIIKNKIIRDWSALPSIITNWRNNSQIIVFTNGCFDILHLGHIELLAGAADLGNKLVIGLNTDHSVKKLKGPGRPVQDEISRANVLAGLGFVDMVVFFGQDTPYELISLIKPDILVKGGDYQPDQVVGYDIVKSYGGKVIIIDLVKGYSSSSAISKLKK